MASIGTLVQADGSWSLLGMPNAVFPASVGRPFQSSGIVFGDTRTYNAGSGYTGPVQITWKGNIRDIPDVGVPGTNWGVKQVLRDHLCDAVAQGYEQSGQNVLAVAMAEYDTGTDLGFIATLGYEIVIVTGNPVGAGQMLPGSGVITPGVLFPRAQRVAAMKVPQAEGQWLLIIQLIIGLLGLDILTEGKVTDSFQKATESIGSGVAKGVAPITQGPALILLGGGALLLGLSYFLNKNPQFGGRGFDQATEFAEKSGKLGELASPAAGIRNIKAVKDIL